MTKPPCPHLGQRFQWSPDGSHPDIYLCRTNQQFCTLEPTNLDTTRGPLANCQECTLRPSNDAPANRDDVCDHRGKYVRTDTADLCGMKGQLIQLYECDNPALQKADGSAPLCTQHRYCHRQTALSCSICLHHPALNNRQE
jgi:hypothetical protein